MKYSVLMPAFKQSYLNEAISSCLSQNIYDWELIVVDDASPEDLKSVVDKFQDERIKYYRNDKNYGALNVVDNWNKCLSYATGDYVICMGDDDKLLPNALEEYTKLIEKYPYVDVFHGWTEVINEQSEVINLLDTRPEWESVYSLMWQRWTVRQQFIGDFLFKTMTLRRNGGFYKQPLAWGSDDITAYINAKEHGVVNTQVPVFQYRQTSITLSSISNGKIKLDALQKEKLWTEQFLSNSSVKNEMDKLLLDLLTQNISARFEKRKIDTITKDVKFSNNILRRVVYWVRLYHSLDIPASKFLKAILKGVSQH